MRRTRGLTVAIGLAALLAACNGADNGVDVDGVADGEAVTISGNQFQPSDLTVPSGTTVEWTNQDSVAHTVTFADGEDAGSLGQGDTYTRTFTEAGSFPYACAIHPTMVATVTVT